jgi:hypothetical protein
VFTAVRETGNTLKVIPWKLSSDGMVFTRTSDGGTVGTTPRSPLGAGVAAAVRDSQNNLRVISWTVSSNGNMGASRRGRRWQRLRDPHDRHAERGLEPDDGRARRSGEMMLIGWS